MPHGFIFFPLVCPTDFKKSRIESRNPLFLSLKKLSNSTQLMTKGPFVCMDSNRSLLSIHSFSFISHKHIFQTEDREFVRQGRQRVHVIFLMGIFKSTLILLFYLFITYLLVFWWVEKRSLGFFRLENYKNLSFVLPKLDILILVFKK